MKRIGAPIANKLTVLSLAMLAGGIWLFAAKVSAGPVQLLSARDSRVSLSAAGNGNSVAPWISADARFVVFSSSASDLVTNDNGYLGLDVFLRDRDSNSTVLVSENLSGTGGGNEHSSYGMASSNGRYVMFESVASDLVPDDTNDMSDIFVRDLWTKSTTLVSVSTNGGSGDGASSDAVMSSDGRYVAFVSAADNLTADDTNGLSDIFVRDLVAGTTTLASVGAGASSTTMIPQPAITPDGRYVAFSTFGTANVFPYGPAGEVYVRDLVAGTTIWASTNAVAIATNLFNATSAQAASGQASISDDGRYVVFKALCTNSLGPTATLILRFDVTNEVTTLINTNGVLPINRQNEDLYGPAMSPDGRFVVYAGMMVNTNTTVIELWDANTGTNILISADMDGNVPTNSLSHSASVSPDGRFVTFLSDATNLVANSVSSGFYVHLRDVAAGVTQLVDANTSGVGATDDWGTVPVLSSNGQFVAYSSRDDSLVASDNNNAYDVFLRDTVGGATELISQRSPESVAQAGNTLSSMGPNSISADGTRVVFTSYASDLVTNDFNDERDVFVRDLLTGSNILVSVGTNGQAGLGGNSVTPVISANGQYVAFASLATNLVANDNDQAADIFRRDLQAGTTVLVGVKLSGTSYTTGRDASAPVISADGRYVAFIGYTNSPSSPQFTLWCDVDGGTTVVLTSGASIGPSISADGQRVAYFTYFNSQSYYLSVWDARLATNIYTNSTAMGSAAISPDGNWLLYQTLAGQLYVADLAAQTSSLIASDAPAIRSSAQWSADGRYFAFVSAANLVGGDTNGIADVYLYDLQNRTMALVSSNYNGTGSANGPSDWPVMSGDGRFVVFRSFATDVLPGVTNAPSLFAFDRLGGTMILLTTGTADTSWSSWISHPAISDNATVAYLNWDSSLVGGDLNRAGDVFSQTVAAPTLTDSDSDGIPDWWMIQYFGHPTGEAGDKSLATDDADGDGMSNLQEYLAGTVPTDFNSVLRIQIATELSGNNVLLTWPATAGKNYHVQYKNDLTDPVWLDATGSVIVIGNQGRFTASGDSSTRYYQVIVVE